jgi:hypothetical protein
MKIHENTFNMISRMKSNVKHVDVIIIDEMSNDD